MTLLFFLLESEKTVVYTFHDLHHPSKKIALLMPYNITENKTLLVFLRLKEDALGA